MADLITDAELLDLASTAGTLTADVTAGQRAAAISAASSVVLSKLRKRHTLPLVSWSDDVKGATADIAAYRLIKLRGFNPSNGRDIAAREAAKESMAWLQSIVDGSAEAEDIVDSSIIVEERGPLIESNSPRGFGGLDDTERLL